MLLYVLTSGIGLFIYLSYRYVKNKKYKLPKGYTTNNLVKDYKISHNIRNWIFLREKYRMILIQL